MYLRRISRIAKLQSEVDRLSEMEKDYQVCKEKAGAYDEDKQNSGGILERAKAESAKIIANCNAEAAEIIRSAKETARIKAEQLLEESEKQVAENIRKVKYLYKRRDELLSAFEKVKDAAGGFYDNIASTLSKSSDD